MLPPDARIGGSARGREGEREREREKGGNRGREEASVCVSVHVWLCLQGCQSRFSLRAWPAFAYPLKLTPSGTHPPTHARAHTHTHIVVEVNLGHGHGVYAHQRYRVGMCACDMLYDLMM